MKILFTGLPIKEHLLTSFNLVKELIKRGHSVSYIISEEWAGKVTEAGALYIPYDNYPIDPKKHHINRLQFRHCVETTLRVGSDYDCIIFDADFYAGAKIAHRLNKKYIRIYYDIAYNTATLKKFRRYLPFFKRLSLTKPFSYFFALNETGRYKKELNISDIASELTLSTISDLNISFISKTFQPENTTFPEKNYVFTGPSMENGKVSCIIPFNAMDSAIIFISVGDKTDNKFLNYCYEAFKNARISVIIAFENGANANTIGPIPDNFYVYPAMLPKEVLKRTDLFITDGSSTKINQALFYGIPVIVYCNNRSDYFLGKRVEQLNLGKKLTKKDLSLGKLRQIVIDLLRNDIILDNIIITEAETKLMGGTAKAADVIEDYIAK